MACQTASKLRSLSMTARRTTAANSIVSPSSYLNKSNQILPLAVQTNSPQRNEQLCRVAARLCPFLVRPDTGKASDSTDNKETLEEKTGEDHRSLSVRPLTGGLSNELFVVENQEICQAVLIRINPSLESDDKSTCIVDRETEHRVAAWLSSEGQAPTYYGRFQNGRVEEFYQNHMPLTHNELAKYGSEAATILARFHALEVPETVLKPPTRTSNNGHLEGHIWTRIDEWFQQLKIVSQSSLSSSTEEENQRNQHRTQIIQNLYQEFQWLRSELTFVPVDDDDDATKTKNSILLFWRSIVFTHMDFQSLNLLKQSNRQNEEPLLLKLIDFEYAHFNARATDIANTFCEHCDMNNLKPDYVHEFPTLEQQRAFVQAYLAIADPSLLRRFPNVDLFWKVSLEELKRHTLVSHLGWAVWSLVQDRLSDVDFDYVAYANHRLEGYEYFKNQCDWSHNTKLAPPSFLNNSRL